VVEDLRPVLEVSEWAWARQVEAQASAASASLAQRKVCLQVGQDVIGLQQDAGLVHGAARHRAQEPTRFRIGNCKSR
jgi:hypothetical protein